MKGTGSKKCVGKFKKKHKSKCMGKSNKNFKSNDLWGKTDKNNIQNVLCM